MKSLGRLLRRAVTVRDGEVAAVLWSCALFFFLLSSYYILRPVRDEMAVTGGVRNLAWLFSATLGAMLLAHPMFTALVARLPRHRFVPLVYRFFILNLIAFFVVFRRRVARHAHVRVRPVAALRATGSLRARS